jgi:hypothetical protein
LVQPNEIVVGSTYVAVIYNDVWWPGIVERLNGHSAHINFMIPQGKNKYIWPSKAQQDDLNLHEVLCILNSAPQPVNQRGQYAFPSAEADRVDALLLAVLKK